MARFSAPSTTRSYLPELASASTGSLFAPPSDGWRTTTLVLTFVALKTGESFSRPPSLATEPTISIRHLVRPPSPDHSPWRILPRCFAQRPCPLGAVFPAPLHRPAPPSRACARRAR